MKYLLVLLTTSYWLLFLCFHIEIFQAVDFVSLKLFRGQQGKKYPKDGRSKETSWLALAVAFPLGVACFAPAVAVCCVQEKKAALGSLLALKRALFLGDMLQNEQSGRENREVTYL